MHNLRKFLMEDEAVIGITEPIDYTYLKMLRITLSAVGAWPDGFEGFSESVTKLLKRFHSIFLIWATISAFTYIILHKDASFFEMGHMYIVAFMDVVDVNRHFTVTLTGKYQRLAVEFLSKMHLFYYKEKSEFAMKTHKRIHLFSHLYTLYVIVLMMGGLSLFNLIPIYNNYSAGRFTNGASENSRFEHSVNYPYPFDYTTKLNGYIIVCGLNWIISYLCSTWFCIFDLFLSLIVFNIYGHLKILINNIENMPKPTENSQIVVDNEVLIISRYTKAGQEAVLKKLKECIDYHRIIVAFANRVSDTYGPMMACYYGFHLTSCCLLLLECSQMTAAALFRYLPLTIIIFQQLIQLSVIFELVRSESEKLKDAVYGVPWEHMDLKTRKVVTFFLMNVQKPIHVKAMGVADVGVTSMAFILKSSLSYFTFLRSM